MSVASQYESCRNEL